MVKKLINIIILINLYFIYFSINIFGMQSSVSKDDSLTIDLSNNKFAMELYNKGIENYREGNIDLAVEYLQKAIEVDDKFAEAYDQLALAYIELETVRARTLAERALKRATELDTKKITYKLHYGKLMLRQGFRYNARKRFEWLKTQDPKNTELYLNLGLIYKKEMEYFKNMVSVSSTDGSILNFIDDDLLSYIFNYGDVSATREIKNILSEKNESVGKYTDFTEYVQKDFANAVMTFSEVLKLDPNNKSALHNLSLLSLEVGMYDKFIEYQEKILKNDPNDKDAHLFLGFGYHLKSKDDIAYREYKKAESLMKPDEKAVFQSIDYIVPHNEIDKYKIMNTEEKTDFDKTFWKQKDPLYLTEYNERTLEHYARVAYANLMFEVESKKIPGWKTDRGKIYIRYGPPREIVRMRAEKGELLEQRDMDLTEVWYYDGFTFAFEDLYLTGDFRLGARTRFPEVQFPEIAEKVYIEKPEIYIPQFQGKKFNFGYYTASFRGENGKSSFEVYYAIPVKDLEPVVEKNYKTTTLTGGIFFFDDKWNEVNKMITKEKLYFHPKLDTTKSFYIIGKNQLEITPGSYNFAIEFQENNSKNTGTYRQELKIDSYPLGELKISDIVLASIIDTVSDSSKFSKNGIKIIPNPARLFHKNQLMHVYFEVYNLTVNPEHKSNFMVEYKISAESEEQKPIITKIISNIGQLIGIDEGKQDITASYQYEGVAPNEKINLAIDMSATKFGIYNLSITTTDLNNNNKVSKSIKLGIQNVLINYLF